MEPGYLTTVFFHFWLMKYSQPYCFAGLSPGQEIIQMFSVFGTGLRFWHKTCLSGSTSLCELWSVTGTYSWLFLLPEDAVANMATWAQFCTYPCATPGQPCLSAELGKETPLPSPSSLLTDTFAGRKQWSQKGCSCHCPAIGCRGEQCTDTGTGQGHSQDRLLRRAVQDKGSAGRMRDVSHRHEVQRTVPQVFSVHRNWGHRSIVITNI